VNILKLPALILTTLITFGSAGAVQAETFDFENSTLAETTLAQGFFRNILHHKIRHHRRNRHHQSNRHHHGNHRQVHHDNHRQVHHGDRRHHQSYRSHQRRQHPHHQNHNQHHGNHRVNYYR